MYNRILECPCPRGVITAASINWKRNKHRRFFGHSYTAPTPKEYTLQQLGLTVTKAYAMHLRKASKFFTCPSTPQPVGFGPADSRRAADDASVAQRRRPQRTQRDHHHLLSSTFSVARALSSPLSLRLPVPLAFFNSHTCESQFRRLQKCTQRRTEHKP